MSSSLEANACFGPWDCDTIRTFPLCPLASRTFLVAGVLAHSTCQPLTVFNLTVCSRAKYSGGDLIEMTEMSLTRKYQDFGGR